MFRRVPVGIWSELGDSPGASCEEAIRRLLKARAKGPVVYKAIGKGGKRRSVRLENNLYAEMKSAADEDNVNINEFFITALRQYVGRD